MCAAPRCGGAPIRVARRPSRASAVTASARRTNRVSSRSLGFAEGGRAAADRGSWASRAPVTERRGWPRAELAPVRNPPAARANAARSDSGSSGSPRDSHHKVRRSGTAWTRAARASLHSAGSLSDTRRRARQARSRSAPARQRSLRAPRSCPRAGPGPPEPVRGLARRAWPKLDRFLGFGLLGARRLSIGRSEAARNEPLKTSRNLA
jgi:hypothetical protein